MHASAAQPVFDLVAEALARAPVVQTFTPEERAEVDQIWDDIRSGRAQTVRHEDLPAWLEEQARRDGRDG